MQQFNNTNMSQSDQNGSIDIKELLVLCLAKWKWFVLSLAVCLGVAAYQILKTPPVYTRHASLLVKDDKKGGNMSSEVSDAFANMGMFTSRTNITNELKSISSPDVVLSVIKRLDLTTNYKVKGRFHEETLYGSSLPLNVTFLDVADNQAASFNVHVGEEKALKLDTFTSRGEEIEGSISGTYSDTLETPLGRVIINEAAAAMDNVHKDIIVRHSPLNSVVRSYASRLSVVLSDKLATILELSFNDVSTQRAEDFLNTLIAVYNENWIQDKNQIAVSTSMFIDERLAVIERELGNVDTDISSYKSEHLIPDVEAASSMYMNQASKAEATVMELNNEVYMAKYIRSYLTGTDDFKLLPANSGITNQNIAKQIDDYNAKLLQRNGLVANSSETNPLVVDLDASLRQMRSAIITSIDNELVTLDSQINSQKRYGSRATSQIASNPDQAKYLLSVERQQKVKEALYLYLLQKREENELSQAFTAYNTRVITKPTGSSAPISPRKSMIMLVALLLGLGIPFGIIYLKEMIDTTIKSRKDIESKVGVPFAGEIPLYVGDSANGKKRKMKNNAVSAIVVADGNKNYINEAFRVLRSNVEFFMGKSSDKNVAIITSYNVGSGKSFIINNLSLALAIRNKKVLLVDCDLRKATVSRFFGKAKYGIADYLGGFIENIDDVIFKSSNNENLSILPVGTIPPNPSELLSEKRFNDLIDSFRSKYDYIFLDCPPLDIVADTAIIEKVADRTLFVVRAGLFDKSLIPVLDNDIKTEKMKNTTLILNGTEAASRYGYSKYGYRYGHHYGYNEKSGYYSAK